MSLERPSSSFLSLFLLFFLSLLSILTIFLSLFWCYSRVVPIGGGGWFSFYFAYLVVLLQISNLQLMPITRAITSCSLVLQNHWLTWWFFLVFEVVLAEIFEAFWLP